MSPWHWLIVIAIAVLLFGARRLPDAARSLGRSARILKAELSADATAAEPSGSADGDGSGTGAEQHRTPRPDPTTGG